MFSIRTLGAGFGASLLALAAGTGGALAADLPNYEPPPAEAFTPVPASSWSGPYVGLTGGYAWSRGSTAAGAFSNNGWVGGPYVGYNLQTNSNLVLGVEGDFLFNGKSGSDGAGTTVSNPWNGTFRGRVGYAFDRFMVYGTAGAAVGRLNATGGINESATKVGWTAGVGVEAKVSEKVTARVEYRHTDLGVFPTGGGSHTSNDILVGVGFKF